MDEEALAKLSVPDLRLRLRAASLPGTGRKAELVTRLVEHGNAPRVYEGVAAPTNPASTATASRRDGREATPVHVPFYSLSGLCGMVFVQFSATTAFYHLHNGWPLPEAFYHAVDAGLSIGSGAIAETDQMSMAFTIVHVLLGASLAAGALGLIVQHGIKRAVNDAAGGQGGQEPRGLLAVLEPTLAALVAWIAAGVAFGMMVEGWTLVESLYFCVTMLSTGGLRSPSLQPHNLVFTGLYALTGVPIFGAVLGQFGGLMAESQTAKELEHTLHHQQLEKSDLQDRAQVDFGEFLAIHLTKASVVDKNIIEKIRRKFDKLDAGGNGVITHHELF